MNFTLRKFRESDLPSLVKYANNHNIAKFLTNGFPHPYSEEDGRKFLSMASNNPGIFAIDVDGEAIGSIGIFPQSDIHAKNAEMGYWLAEPFWGNGIIPRAIKEIVEYGFQTFNIIRIFARPFSTNRASQRVLEKAGFVCEARLKNAIYKNGNYLDELIYVVTVLQKKAKVKKAFSIVATLVRIHLISMLDVYELLRGTKRSFEKPPDPALHGQLTLNFD